MDRSWDSRRRDPLLPQRQRLNQRHNNRHGNRQTRQKADTKKNLYSDNSGPRWRESHLNNSSKSCIGQFQLYQTTTRRIHSLTAVGRGGGKATYVILLLQSPRPLPTLSLCDVGYTLWMQSGGNGFDPLSAKRAHFRFSSCVFTVSKRRAPTGPTWPLTTRCIPSYSCPRPMMSWNQCIF